MKLEDYFNEQMKDPKTAETYKEISEEVDHDLAIAKRTREIQSRIPKKLLQKRLKPGGCYCEELTSDGFCKHCGCKMI